ncbi:ATP-binding protein [Bacillus sp. AFS073361]|uniref:ATP-binding protein n=1 Tax=Bacillus sp. AFS073361 TaxID=2033511 RepID=UPI00211D815E|nr:ATP-binding protein [Bacillus sp. AFS073361]
MQILLHLYHQDLQIDIYDSRKGMTQEQINRLGEPYFTTKEKGTGLGMIVSFSIIKGMNGSINLTSEPQKGTCFSIRLPLYQKIGEPNVYKTSEEMTFKRIERISSHPIIKDDPTKMSI